MKFHFAVTDVLKEVINMSKARFLQLDVSEEGDVVVVYADDAASDLEFEALEAGVEHDGATGEERKEVDVAGQNVEGTGAVGGADAHGLAFVIGLVRADDADFKAVFELFTVGGVLLGGAVCAAGSSYCH